MSTFPVPAYMEIHHTPTPPPPTPKFKSGDRVKVISGLALHGCIGSIAGESIVAGASEYKMHCGYHHYPVKLDGAVKASSPLLFQETELTKVTK